MVLAHDSETIVYDQLYSMKIKRTDDTMSYSTSRSTYSFFATIFLIFQIWNEWFNIIGQIKIQ